MISSSHSVVVNSKKSKVFDYLDQPKNHQDFTPSLEYARSLRRLDNGGKLAQYKYKMFGLSFTGTLREIERKEGEYMRFNMSGDISGEIYIRVERVGHGTTEVEYSAEYKISENDLIDSILSPIASSYNDVEVKKLLLKMKSKIEQV